jgi:hypothetical protein
MFGTFFGATSGLGKSGLESLTLNPIWPLNGSGGTGSTSCPNALLNEIPQASVEFITANHPALGNLISVVFMFSARMRRV